MLGSGSFAYRGAKKKAPHRFVDAFSLNLSIDSVFLRLSLDVKDAFKNLAERSGETKH